jgi:hypothetical protein
MHFMPLEEPEYPLPCSQEPGSVVAIFNQLNPIES